MSSLLLQGFTAMKQEAEGTSLSADRHPRLLRALPDRPRSRRTAEQRDEIAAFQMIELHSLPASQGQIAGYRTDGDSGLDLDPSGSCDSSSGMPAPVAN